MLFVVYKLAFLSLSAHISVCDIVKLTNPPGIIITHNTCRGYKINDYFTSCIYIYKKKKKKKKKIS